ncbi:hypothetical protein DACRYDRAFT_101823 [Dacryopinax primogenitus]|uniref:YTH domain-containing protein n=1 Tax=Dacryopinax primogenitus (strain DJM 731) TaxID=1858805 RepID=M5FTR6_DACPD|nr:uncharacterized protein DACRYDRAFT_101823 [Dacryopinax primogenitus]EJT98829.1 hypothetical protein DACRYDRAFT_101823 [Dacryopinax primogenitus]
MDQQQDRHRTQHRAFSDPEQPFTPPNSIPSFVPPSEPFTQAQTIYDSSASLRAPWAPAGPNPASVSTAPAPASTVGRPPTSPLRAVGAQAQRREPPSPDLTGARLGPALSNDGSAGPGEEEVDMHRSGSRRSDRQVPPRRQEPQQPRQLPLARQPFPQAQMSYGPVGAPGDPYGRPPAAATYAMPSVYGQQPPPLPYNPRGYSPSYPSPMQVMIGSMPVVGPPGTSYAPGAPFGSYQPAPDLLTSPLAFGNPPPFSFQRISPDPVPPFPQPPRVPQGQRPPYPPSSFHFSPPPPASPPPPGTRPLQPQQPYPLGYPPGSSALQGYSPVFGVPTSPVFTQPRFPSSFPGSFQSPEEVQAQAGAGTWYFVPNQDPQSSFDAQARARAHAHGHGGHTPLQQQAQYPQAYGLGFPHPQMRNEDGFSGAGQLSPSMFPAAPVGTGEHPLRASYGHGQRPSLSQSVSSPPTDASSDPRVRSPESTLRGSTSTAVGGAGDSSFSQVSQIPFPSLAPASGTQPNQASRPQRRPSSPTRKPYHPNPPTNRSEWVMWVGNVPHDATHDELWRYFNQLVPVQPFAPPVPGATQTSTPGQGGPAHTAEDQPGGVSSVFLISRSNCAFVNFNSESHLERAVAFFNNKPIRPNDPRCPRLVCRVRRKDDDLRAGVGGQRGVGIHTRWVKEQREKESEELQDATLGMGGKLGEDDDQPPDTPTRQKTLGHQGSSGSFTSTNSSFLQKYFPKRYFILKSLTQFDLNLSVERGIWATQAHNEPVLDQAFRTSTDVYLIFGANKSGEFYGYARMAGPVQYPGKIDKSENRISWASRTESSHSSNKSIEGPLSKRPSQPEMIAEDQEGEKREEKKQDEGSPQTQLADNGTEIDRAIAENPQPKQDEAMDVPPSLEVSAPEIEESAVPEGSLGERREEVPGPMVLPRTLVETSEGSHSIAASPQPMTSDESKSLEDLEPNETRPVHHPHFCGILSRRQSLRPAPQPTGDDAPKPPLPLDVASAPAEIGPERKGFSFDQTATHNTIDGGEVYQSSSLPVTLASQPAGNEVVAGALSSAADIQATLGSSSLPGEVDKDGIMRRDTALSLEDTREHEKMPVPERQRPAESLDQPEERTTGPSESTVLPEEEPAHSPATPKSPEVEASHRPAGKEEESWGTPFKIEWIKVEPLPFYRARHLRNPWNNDREVKVSRDGTELEPTVGARLLQEWDRLPEEPTPAPAASGRNRGSRPPFRTTYSTPSAQMTAMQNSSLSISPYIPGRDNTGNVPQWLFQGRSQIPWQQ